VHTVSFHRTPLKAVILILRQKMKIITDLNKTTLPSDGSVLAIGNFDGIHRGHQAIIATARDLARKNNLPLIVMIFDPAPVKVLRPELAPRILTPTIFKTFLLEDQGIDQLIVVPTDKAFLAQSPDEFIENLAVNKLRATHIVEGENFAFGRHRQGTTEVLQELGARFGFEAHIVGPQTLKLDNLPEPIVVSSTFIRQQISACEFSQVRECLGRFYDIPGRIVRGQGRGHKIGFPTANLELLDPDQLVPLDGVFAGYVRLGDSFDEAGRSDEYYAGAISIGSCETFVDGHWQIEAHLLDLEAPVDSLYDKHLLISFVQRIRQQEKYDSLDALVRAINADCKQIRLTLLNTDIHFKSQPE
jgi:riboflavin kinase/FMN adenylyltransferase